MRSTRWAVIAVVAGLMAGCGQDDPAGTGRAETVQADAPPSDGAGLPCAQDEQTGVSLDVPGPGRPTPEEAVAPYAGALDLTTVEAGDRTEVHGLRDDGTVLRVFQVTEHDDGWWPDGYTECRT